MSDVINAPVLREHWRLYLAALASGGAAAVVDKWFGPGYLAISVAVLVWLGAALYDVKSDRGGR